MHVIGPWCHSHSRLRKGTTDIFFHKSYLCGVSPLWAMTSQADACSYCMGSAVSILSQIYIYSSNFEWQWQATMDIHAQDSHYCAWLGHLGLHNKKIEIILSPILSGNDLKVKMRVTATGDHRYLCMWQSLLYLPWPPWVARQKNRNDPISVVPPKVAKASTIVTVVCHCHVSLSQGLLC